MLGDDISPFLSLNDFAIEVRFANNDVDFYDLNGIFDNKGTVIRGVVLEAARLVAEKSKVDKGWMCEIDDLNFEVLYKVNGQGNYCEYILKNITDIADRVIV